MPASLPLPHLATPAQLPLLQARRQVLAQRCGKGKPLSLPAHHFPCPLDPLAELMRHCPAPPCPRALRGEDRVLAKRLSGPPPAQALLLRPLSVFGSMRSPCVEKHCPAPRRAKSYRSTPFSARCAPALPPAPPAPSLDQHCLRAAMDAYA